MPVPHTPRNPIAAVDWPLLSILLALLAIGWSMIYAVGYGGAGYQMGWTEWLTETTSGKQAIFLGVSLVLLLATLVMDHRVWRNGAYIVYIVALLMLVGVLVFGKEIKGAKSWYAIGGFSLQPSEFAKFGTILAVASLLAAYRGQVRSKLVWLQAVALFAVPAGLVLLQPDAGSALVFAGLTLVLYRAGLNAKLYLLAMIVGALLVVGLVVPPLQVGMALVGLAIAVLAAQLDRGALWATLSLAALAGLFYLQRVRPELAVTMLLTVALPAFAVIAGYWYTHRKSQLVLALTAVVTVGTGIATTAKLSLQQCAGAPPARSPQRLANNLQNVIPAARSTMCCSQRWPSVRGGFRARAFWRARSRSCATCPSKQPISSFALSEKSTALSELVSL